MNASRFYKTRCREDIDDRRSFNRAANEKPALLIDCKQTKNRLAFLDIPDCATTPLPRSLCNLASSGRKKTEEKTTNYGELEK